jgi:hypothetical protein
MQIKPCPFCGETNVYVKFIGTVETRQHFSYLGDNVTAEYEDRAEPQYVSGVLCNRCHALRRDLRYDRFLEVLTEEVPDAILPQWYAALPPWRDKEAAERGE